MFQSNFSFSFWKYTCICIILIELSFPCTRMYAYLCMQLFSLFHFSLYSISTFSFTSRFKGTAKTNSTWCLEC